MWAKMCAEVAVSTFDVVHFVEGFVDGVLNGTADYHGAPHHFELRSAEPDQPEVYLLTPLTAQVFEAVTEAWEIWRRWEQAQQAAVAPLADGIPALPTDRERQAALRGFISNWLASAKESAFLAEGDFEHASADEATAVRGAGLRVKWHGLGPAQEP
jgi:hypothetical protein